MTAVRPPTARQLDLLRLLAAENDRGGSPSFREIAAALGIRSTNAVSDLMFGLEARGLIEPRKTGAMRAARVTGAGRAALGVAYPLAPSDPSDPPDDLRAAFEAGYRKAEHDHSADPDDGGRLPEPAMSVDIAFREWFADLQRQR